MKKLFFFAACLFLFSCESNRTTETESDTAGTENTTSDNPADLEKGSGTEISPQLEGVEDSAARLEVDTAKTSNTTR